MTAPAETITLFTPVADLPGIAPRHREALIAMGLTNVGRLVDHLPHRHEREEAEAPIADLEPGRIVSARGDVTATRVAGLGRKRRFEAVLHDGTARLDLVWFNQAYLAQKIGAGTRLRVQGTLAERGGQLQIANPRFEILPEAARDEPGDASARLRPVYPATEAADSRAIERAIRGVLPAALPLLEDHLPAVFRDERDLPSLAEAYRLMHDPGEDDAAPKRARRRLAYDELLLLQLGVHLKRARLRETFRAPALPNDEAADRGIRAHLPFALTDAQNKVVREIAADLATDRPANRLVQGDVGSGKTAVALYAMLMAVGGGHQAALMAPTSILAEQHALSISTMLEKTNIRVELLTGATPEDDRARVLARLRRGEIDLLVGTHALLTDRVRFRSLAVAVIDEQHRFGVVQRATLRTKAEDTDGDGRPVTPHVVVMTATPIPRTVGMTLFGDLDVSTIDALPPGRTPVRTRVVGRDTRAEVYGWLRGKLDAGEQAFVVAPTIDDAENLPGEGDPPASLRGLLAELEAGPLAGARTAAVHGRLKRATREHVMARFRAGLIDAIVATTVIEVGVDVPNATAIVIESAERFGLAQLHQLRGRVGRGDKPGVCVLVADATTDDAQARLKVMAETASGFELAERDFQIRGPGELFGTRQSGLPPFRVADLLKDTALLSMARRDAAAWIERSPGLAAEDESLLLRRLMKRYGRALELGDVA